MASDSMPPVRSPWRVRPRLEALEDRTVPTFTYHGGALLSHVEVQALYYGSDWSTPTYAPQMNYLEGYLGNIVNSSYMDMLTVDGYGVARGTASAGRVAAITINKNVSLTDAQLQSGLQAAISTGGLAAPDANRLYVIYVEDNVVVSTSFGTSQTSFLGYHGAFAGRDAGGAAADIRYAVLPYPGGSVGNASLSWLSTLGSLTAVTSHEMAEAVTDPDVNYRTLGWYDDTLNGEVGDIVNGSTTNLNGYAIQRISDQNDHAMTPAGAAAATQETFVLVSGGVLLRYTASGGSVLTGGIAAISDQGVDDHGQVMVDVITTGGLAFEYHEGSGFTTFLGSAVTSARAGQAVSYVLHADGSLMELDDENGWTSLGTGVRAISAGTDQFGVNMVDVVLTSGAAWEFSDSTGQHFLASGVQAVSAGRQGFSTFLKTSGEADLYFEWTATTLPLLSGVSQITAGTDPAGNLMFDFIDQGIAVEFRLDTGLQVLATGVQSIAAARAGLLDLILTSGIAFEHAPTGWTVLGTSVLAVG
jgi:hypothetical protein